MSRVSLRTTFVAAAVLVVAAQLIAVTLAALPPNRYSDAARPHLTHLDPFFTQNWRLFAPNPVAEDRSMLFQGSYATADGTIKRTAWVDWTEVELDLVHHRLVGGRAGYVTNKLYGPLGQRYARLGTSARAMVDSTSEKSPPSWRALRSTLSGEVSDRRTAEVFLRYERAAVRLATAVLRARWPDRELIAVRYRLREQPVVPYEARSGSEAERVSARSSPRDRDSGWRVPVSGTARERAVVADFDRRHR